MKYSIDISTSLLPLAVIAATAFILSQTGFIEQIARTSWWLHVAFWAWFIWGSVVLSIWSGMMIVEAVREDDDE